MTTLQGSRDGSGLRIGVVVARFNETVTEGLLRGALGELRACGVAEQAITVVRVPGALELAGAAAALIASRSPHAVVVLGAVIRGETDHYDFVCSGATRDCGEVSLRSGVPVLFGLLTCHTLAQAAARSGPDGENKGAECARGAVEMATLRRVLDAPEDTPPTGTAT